MNRIARRENIIPVDEIIKQHDLLQSALTPFGETLKQLFATPQSSSAGVLEWYSSLQGQPIEFNALDPEEKKLLLEKLHYLFNIIHAKKAYYQDPLLSEVVKRAIQSPLPENIYSLNGSPILILDEQLTIPVNSPIVPPPLPPEARSKLNWWLPLGALLIVILSLLAYFLWNYWNNIDETKQISEPLPKMSSELRQIKPPALPQKSQLPLKLAIIPEPIAEKVPEPLQKVASQPVEIKGPTEQKELEKIALCKKEKLKQAQDKAQMIILIDASYSMMLNMNASEHDISLWERSIPTIGIEDEPRRMSIAKKATIDVINKLPAHVDIGLVTAFDCKRVDLTRMVTQSQRGSLIKKIQGIKPEGATALAEALMFAGQQLDPNKESMILVISDGKETCDGDPCAVANALANAHPKLTINVIDILGAGAGICLANATDGKVFKAQNATDINSMLKAATQEIQEIKCD